MIIAMVAVAVLASIATAISPEGPTKEIVKITGALVIIISIASPILQKNGQMKFDLKSIGAYQQMKQSAQNGQEAQKQLTQNTITKQIESYLSEKLERSGIQCKVNIEAGENESGAYEIWAAEVIYSGPISEAQRKQAENLLTEECGLTQEQQRHQGG